ncbi:MAG: hypothetical protein IJ300_11320 [Clostridia bacterium]|nr:hypothetical protein [Clostridia bacterium]
MNDIIDKIHMGDIYRMQLCDLNEKVDELLEQDRDDIAEMYKTELMELREKIKACDEARVELNGIIERARLTPLEYLLFDLRCMKKMQWNDIVKKIENSPEVAMYRGEKDYYKSILGNGMNKIKAAGE